MGNTDARQYAALVLRANSYKASTFLDERMRDGRIASRTTLFTSGKFLVCLKGPSHVSMGTSTDSEEDALAQASTDFACWEYAQGAKTGGELGPCC